VEQDLVAATASGDRRAGEDLVRGFRSAEAGERALLLDELAASAGQGSSAGLEVLLRLIDEHRLDRVAIRRVLIDDDQADDAHQDVLIAVARSIHRFRGDSRFTTWLHTVARNTAVDHLRRRRETVPVGSDLDLLTDARRISSLVAVRADLRAALAALPDLYRVVVVLRDVEQKTYLEIADQLDLEVNTVKSRLSRGRALLAASISGEGPVDGAPTRG
jgi:RNA polymerase sigma-70 factor, ECF subfamily